MKWNMLAAGRAGIAAVIAAAGLTAGCTERTRTAGVTPASATALIEATGPSALPAAPRVDVPADLNPFWLEGRRTEQLAAADQSDVFRGFGFTDRQPESGIDFRGHVTEDSAKTFKEAHYDHGCGMAVADVDGDGLVDIYFVRVVGESELWRNRGDGTFEDVTKAAGLSLSNKLGISGSFADIDNDGDADLYATVVRGSNVLYENDGTGHFTDISAGSGLDYVGHSSGATFFDYDRDGRLDLFLSNVGRYTTDIVRDDWTVLADPSMPKGELTFYEAVADAFGSHLKPERTERSLLFHNEGGNRFVDVTDAVGLVAEGWTDDATVIDGNDDGWPDLYVLNMQGNDGYFQNEGGTRFAPRREAVFPKTPWGSMGVQVLDFENDGRLDLYVTDMHSDMSAYTDPLAETDKSAVVWPDDYIATDGASIFGNALFKNEGPDSFRDVSDAAGAEMFWPWGLSVGDLNADGFEDAFITAGMGYGFRYGLNSVLINDGGEKLLASEFILGIEPRRDGQFAGPQFELDCSGVDQAHKDCKGQEGRITVWGALSSRSSAIFDIENDGDLDIVTNELNDVPMVLTSNLAQVKPDITQIRVRLTGTRSNRDGLGAKVTVVSGDRRLLQVNDGNTGYLSHGLLPLTFGMDGGQADSIEVVWPSGETQTVSGPFDASATVTIEEPATAAAK